MCDTDNASPGSMLSKSVAVHLLPIQEGGDTIVAGNGTMPITSSSSNSIDTMQHQLQPLQPPQQHSTPLPVLLDDIATENFWLREKMKEITADRDRLLCEVANLRLELDMAELKRIPEDRFVVPHLILFDFFFSSFFVIFFLFYVNLICFVCFVAIRNHSE